MDTPQQPIVLTNAELTAEVRALAITQHALVSVLAKIQRDDAASTFAGRLRWLVLGR